MVVPVVFRRGSEGAIASYDWTDLAEGVGYVQYSLFNTRKFVASDVDFYWLTTQGLYSYAYGTSAQAMAFSGSMIKEIDLDFDITYNLPKNIKGTFFYNYFLELSGCNVTDNASIEAVTILTKVSNSVSTVLSTETSGEILAGVSGSTSREVISSHATIANRVHFKKGDILRVTIEIYGKLSSGECNVALLHDPANYTTAISSLPGNSTISIPYEIDL